MRGCIIAICIQKIADLQKTVCIYVAYVAINPAKEMQERKARDAKGKKHP